MTRSTVVAAIVGVGVGLVAGLSPSVHAGSTAKVAAEVHAARQLCTRVAPSGSARITSLAQGEKAFLGLLELAPGAKVATHRDPAEEYIHVLQGHGEIVIDGVRHQVSPGDTVFMPAQAQVSFENGVASLTAMQVFAGPAPAAKYQQWQGCVEAP